MSDSEVDELFQQLRREYLSESEERLAELRAGLSGFQNRNPGALASLKTHFHRLAGSGGSYGFPEISALAKEAELWVATGPALDETAVARLQETIRRLDEIFNYEKRER
jgi:HPt (histidine-containing phosphotransfer) domain-containing protein